VAAVLALILMATSQPETRPREQRVDSSVRSALSAYVFLLRDRTFMAWYLSVRLVFPVSLLTWRILHSY